MSVCGGVCVGVCVCVCFVCLVGWLVGFFFLKIGIMLLCFLFFSFLLNDNNTKITFLSCKKLELDIVYILDIDFGV